uniref:Phenylalanine--tRNA ligase beta subunit, chloroplastic n=1 Tax=Fistulifera saprophila TaxID=880757 RepID=A0A8F0WG53_9STRA|nr:phenylalanine tRNA synthetase [Fistulifera saprophila]QWM93410.1 phenylalanine tRNA synthetase [Fistulifera saprophila]
MQISLKWINELVNIEKIKLDTLVEKLTLGGFEVEEILEIEISKTNQIVLDISATANRSDSLSIQGIASEIAALLNTSLNISTHLLRSEKLKQIILQKATIFSINTGCTTLLSVSVENLVNRTIPKWITKKLLSSGVTPSNTLVDFQSYILLETGYPFAFYDFDKIIKKVGKVDFELSVSRAADNESFVASNNENYNLDPSILLIKANELPLSIGGIIESQEFSCDNLTKSILIEASIFNAATIRQQSRKLGLRTDRSTRYEKSVKNTYLIESLYRLISLLRISNPNLTIKLETIIKANEQIINPIILNYGTLKEILGPTKKLSNNSFEYIDSKTIEDYLNRLNCIYVYNDKEDAWIVTVPHSRSDDLTREIDLIEEIGRLHGFNNFLITLPKLQVIGTKDKSYQTRQKLTSCLLNLGLNELIHYSLVNEKTFLTNQISLVNPLVSEYASLRVSLLPNLIRTSQENWKQSSSIINGFEYGHVFSLDTNTNFKEKEYVAGILGGLQTKTTWSESEQVITWFEAKGRIERLFEQLNVPVIWKSTSTSSNHLQEIFHKYRHAEIYRESGTLIGNFGQIHPILANDLSISSNLYLFEFDLAIIQVALENNNVSIYKEYSSYPKIIKDISFIIKQDIEFNQLKQLLYLNGSQFLSKINLLDEYKGNSIPEDHTSLCLQLIFQSNEKTLQNSEIEEILNNIRFVLTHEFNATIRN